MHAQVFKCWKKEDEDKLETFAVKVARENDEEKKMAHINEYKITKAFNHKNIVKSIEFFDNEIKGEIH
jgi:serine/threonine protein kinase